MSEQAGSTISAEQHPPEMSSTQRFFGAFMEPASTFASIARKPNFWPPLIALMVIWAAASELMLHVIGMDTIIRRSIELSGRANNMTPEQMQKAIDQGSKAGAIFAHLSFLGVPIILIVIAAIGMLILKAVFGHPVGFKTAFSVTAYADLPSIIAGILGMIVIGFGDPASFNPRNFIPTNIGFYLSPESVSHPVYSIAMSLDVFSFWFMALLGIGFAAAAGSKVRARSVFFCFLGLWVIWVLIKAGLAAI
ncbi:MAG TPA: YIP1 family protein [Terriglobia bacterium]|nr:YIP1 family protein [Terriglobia bacterium]